MIRVFAPCMSIAGVAMVVLLTACSKHEATTLSATPTAPDAQEPSSNLNLNLTEISLSRDTVPAGETVTVKLFTKNASGVKTSFKNVRIRLGLRGGSSLGTFGDIKAQEGGLYVVEFTARRAGTPAELEVQINGEVPRGIAPRLTVVPGPVSLAQSVVVVNQAQVKTGTSTKILFKALDALGNQLTTGGLKVAFALNEGLSSGNFGPVADHQDGTYSAEFTGLVAGGPAPVLAKVGGQPITSALPAVTVTAGDFSPLMTLISVTSATVRSGEITDVTIAAKDAYGNRLMEGGQTFALQLQDGTSTGTFGPVRDLQNGTYVATFTGWAAGSPARITATSAGQTVGTSAQVTVTSGKHDPSKSSLACAASKITMGGSFICTLTVKDQYDNLTAVDSSPVFALKDGTSHGEFTAAQSSSIGVYTTIFTAKKEGTPTRVFAEIGNSLATSASPLIEVLFPSLTQSSITLDADKIGSGKNTTVRFQSRDSTGEAIAAEGLNLVFSASGSGSSTVEIGAVQDRGDGVYVATVTGHRAGTPIQITTKINERSFEGTTPSLTVTSGELAQIQIESAGDGTGRALGSQELADGASIKAYLVGRDSGGNFVAELKASNWSLSDTRVGALSETSGSMTELIANRAATDERGVRIKASYPGPPALTTESGAIHIKNIPSSVPDLVRWYRAESFLPTTTNNTLVGDSKDSPWYDSGSVAPYNGNEGNSKRRPTFLTTGIDGRPAVRFCNSGSGCPDSTSDRIRIDVNFNEFPLSEQDITIFAVAAPETGGANYILGANDNQRGFFLGWTNGNALKFGFGGSHGSNAITAQTPASEKPTWEMITAILDRGEDSKSPPRLSLFRNASLLIAEESPDDDKNDKGGNGNGSAAKGVAIPYLGFDTKGIQIGEVMIYKRALEKDERCKIHTYLNEKYSLKIPEPCEQKNL